jgi:hypothetical protein
MLRSISKVQHSISGRQGSRCRGPGRSPRREGAYEPVTQNASAWASLPEPDGRSPSRGQGVAQPRHRGRNARARHPSLPGYRKTRMAPARLPVHPSHVGSRRIACTHSAAMAGTPREQRVTRNDASMAVDADSERCAAGARRRA